MAFSPSRVILVHRDRLEACTVYIDGIPGKVEIDW
jgi:hypothetical protein